MGEPAQPSCTPGQNFLGFIDCGSGAALNSSGTTVNTLAAAIAGSFASFGIQFLAFSLLRLRLSRIYRPRSYLVPERERVPPPPPGLFRWLVPLFTTPNLAFIQKCGLDAYFFLRYLRMLLKFFFPVAVVVLPILLPLNKYSGNSQKGLDQLSINNVAARYVGHRLWAHLILAILVILWFCYVVYKELRGYIRVRQAFLTSPQHRIRASATTVLVTGIPRKWLSLEALSGLYDVFPGGIKNIWINRNFDELSDKVQYRDKIALQLEGAETDLIKKCMKEHKKAVKKGQKAKTKKEKQEALAAEDAAAEQMAAGDGTSAGDQHHTPHGLQDMLNEAQHEEEREHQRESKRYRKAHPLGKVGQGLNKVGLGVVDDGLGAFGQGIGGLAKGVGNFGQTVVKDVDNTFHKVGDEFDRNVNAANQGYGFATDDELFRQSGPSTDFAPSPPAKTPAVERQARSEAHKSAERDLGPENQSQLSAAQGDATADDHSNEPSQEAGGQTHPLAMPAHIPDPGESSPTSERTMPSPEMNIFRPSVESKPRSQMEFEDSSNLQSKQLTWKLWKNNDRSLELPSPQPHTGDEDEFPLTAKAPRATVGQVKAPAQKISGSKLAEKVMFWRSSDEEKEQHKIEYPVAINGDYDEDQDEKPRWQLYIEPKDRDTMRLPIFNLTWWPSLPLIGTKVDKIYWLRRELARLNLAIEADQNDVERFPFMNSAFIQFNHQVAAHMACQSLSHHIPQQMAPRLVEISPDDVLWDNMSIKWWERYIRTGLVLAICAGLIILYAIPVTFTSLLSKLGTLGQTYRWLGWVSELPDWLLAAIQGILPAALLNLILVLVPLLFRALVKQQGVPTGNAREMGVQVWYFAFLFIQVFFVVTLSSGLTAFFQQFATQPTQVVRSLAQSLPRASDYFYSYLMVQALSSAASTLLQVGTLFFWFIVGPILDSTPRAKWKRQTTLSNIQWGTFFPPFTNYATIGIIYSVISPLILVFMLIIFSLFWIVYRYNVLYVTQFRNDTGGLLFPTAINQLFTGIYFMELCLCGYFFISKNPGGKVACIPQGAIMVVCIVFTIVYQWQLNATFRPLFQYLPITLEDEAVIRDDEFARAQASKFAPLRDGEGDEDADSIQDQVEAREQAEEAANEDAKEKGQEKVVEVRQSSRNSQFGNGSPSQHRMTKSSWAHQRSPNTDSPDWKTSKWHKAAPQAVANIRHLANDKGNDRPTSKPGSLNPQSKSGPRDNNDVEAQHTVGDVLFSGFADELEDLTPEERDLLVRYAFQHVALRAKRPVVWIPRDKLGVSDDEIKRAKRMSTVEIPADSTAAGDEKGRDGKVEKTNIWMSNEGTALDGKGRVVFRRSPPDFSNVDLIAL